MNLSGWLRRFVREERVLAAGLAGVGGLKVGAMLLGVLLTLLLARLLGPEGLGQYAFAFSVATLLTLPVLQGLPVLLLREVSRAPAPQKAAASSRLMRYAVAVVALAAVVLVALALVFWGRASGRAFGTDVLLTSTALALPLLLVLTLCLGAVLRANGHAVAGQVPDLAVRPAVFLLLLLLAWASLRLQAATAMALHVAAAVVALVAAWYQARARGMLGRSDSTPMPVAAWTLALLPLSTLAGMQLINSQVDLVILGLYGQERDVGIYRVATLLALQTSFMLAIVTAVAAPSFASLHARGDWRELKRINRLSARLALMFGVALFLVYLVAGRWLLGWAVGPEYLPAYLPLVILSAAHAASLWAGTTNVLLTMIGHDRDVLGCAVVSVACNIGLNLVLVPRFGAIGAACSSAGALVIWRALLSWRLAVRLAAGKEQG
jgi:O-antigen/teichoic acid export membrane protein